MSIKVCTAEYLLSTVEGMDLRRTWFPRVVAERFLESTKDGEIARCPDPVTMIDGDLSYYNASADAQWLTLQVMRAPRSIVAQNPSTVIIHDAWSWAVGVNPHADRPSVMQDSFGGRVQIDRPEVQPEKLRFGRFFADGDSTNAYVTIGEITPGRSLHFHYQASVQTPGTWTAPTEFEPRWEAYARWARLVAIASPVGAQ